MAYVAFIVSVVETMVSTRMMDLDEILLVLKLWLMSGKISYHEILMNNISKLSEQ